MVRSKPSGQERRPPATTKEVAEFLRKKPHTLENWRVKGFGPPWRRVGHDVQYDWDEVYAWWDAQTGKSSGNAA